MLDTLNCLRYNYNRQNSISWIASVIRYKCVNRTYPVGPMRRWQSWSLAHQSRLAPSEGPNQMGSFHAQAEMMEVDLWQWTMSNIIHIHIMKLPLSYTFRGTNMFLYFVYFTELDDHSLLITNLSLQRQHFRDGTLNWPICIFYCISLSSHHIKIF
jgi:hypothetical protein